MNSVQVVLSGFSMSYVLSRQKLYVGRLYVFLCCTRVCVCRCDVDVICIGHDLNCLCLCSVLRRGLC